MREIIFRGKCKRTDEWVYGYYHNMGDKEHYILEQGTQYCFEVIPETIGQFTGLTDKNGVKIFEGDKFILNNKEMHVEYVKDFCCYILTTGNGYDSHNSRSLDCDIVYYEEIIGNIHYK